MLRRGGIPLQGKELHGNSLAVIIKFLPKAERFQETSVNENTTHTHTHAERGDSYKSNPSSSSFGNVVVKQTTYSSEK